jgi:hypothetical protein
MHCYIKCHPAKLYFIKVNDKLDQLIKNVNLLYTVINVRQDTPELIRLNGETEVRNSSDLREFLKFKSFYNG